MENQTRRTRKTEQSDRPVEPLPGPASDSPPTVLALIERVVLDPRADAEKLERMMAMYERLKAKEAELAYNAAKGGVAAVDRIDRCQGRGAHCVSRATTYRSGEAIWLTDDCLPEQSLTTLYCPAYGLAAVVLFAWYVAHWAAMTRPGSRI